MKKMCKIMEGKKSMKQWDIKTTIMMVSLSVASSVYADATMITKNYNNGIETPASTVMVKNNKVYMEMHTGGKTQYVIYSDAEKTLTMVNPERKMYYAIGQDTINKQAKMMHDYRQQMMQQMQQKMAGMTDQQRTMMEQQMAKMGMGKKTSTVPVLKEIDTGKTVKVNNIQCRIHHLMREAKLEEAVCMASYTDLGISQQDYATLKAMFNFMENMSASAKMMNGHSNEKDFKLQQLEGIPASIRNGNTGSENKIVSVNTQPIDAKKFMIPPEYHKFDPSKMTMPMQKK